MQSKNIILKTIFGSHLYGTDTPASDKDYKVVYMPSKGDILLNKRLYTSYHEQTKVGKGKNTKDDIDIEYIPLHQFIKLACQGDTMALDLLHVPNNIISEKNYIWDKIQERRKTFYTKNLKVFVGYARKQASKYRIKGSRLDTCKVVLDALLSKETDTFGKVKDIWDWLPDIEHTNKSINKNGLREYKVCGRKIQETQNRKYAYDIVKHYYDVYGERAKLAKENKNIDWKAVSHAIRAAYEVLSIYNNSNIIFPLIQAEFLKEVKLGKLDYLIVVAPILESLMDKIEEKSKTIDLPEEVNKEWWEYWLMETVEKFHWGN